MAGQRQEGRILTMFYSFLLQFQSTRCCQFLGHLWVLWYNSSNFSACPTAGLETFCFSRFHLTINFQVSWFYCCCPLFHSLCPYYFLFSFKSGLGQESKLTCTSNMPSLTGNSPVSSSSILIRLSPSPLPLRLFTLIRG